jgi:hypothetical protein
MCKNISIKQEFERNILILNRGVVKMQFNSEQEKYVKEIAEKINDSTVIEIQDREITEDDIKNLGDYEYILTTHKKGFNISARKKYTIELFLGIPTLMFSVLDEYIVADELFGQHGLVWTAEECAEYINGLLGYYDNIPDEEL